jgi:uncharacterized membrane protein
MNTLSKKRMLFGSLLLSILGIILGSMSDSGNCGQSDSCLLVAYPLLAFVPVFVFSLIAYFQKEEVFTSWRKLTNRWLVVTVILVAVSPAVHADMIGFEKKSTLFILVSIYVTISLVLIAYKSYKLRGK